MRKIVVIGAGFAGVAAIERLKRAGPDLELVLIDKRSTSDFLPALPDTIGRGIKSKYLAFRIEDFSREKKIKFINQAVTAVNLEEKQVFLPALTLNYDYLLIASGSETNFYGNNNIRDCAYKLNSAEDAQIIINGLITGQYDNFIICGAGYTGVEVAANLRVFLKKTKQDSRIILLERANSILGPLPQWMKEYVRENLNKLSIEVILNSSLEKIEGKKVFLSGGLTFERALAIWAAGVKAADFIQDLKVEKNPQGRIAVDEHLRLAPDCFAAGDAANFFYRQGYLRMAVQFAIFEGRLAAENILRSIRKRQLRKYRPIDLGYIIPMANNRSCGIILGIKLKGRLPTFFHYLMCIYRCRGIKNKFGLLKGLLGEKSQKKA